VFEAAFCEFGLPIAIRSDNGPPFASTGVGGLSQLAVWWIKLGVKPEINALLTERCGTRKPRKLLIYKMRESNAWYPAERQECAQSGHPKNRSWC